MEIAVVGISHRTASFDLLERTASAIASLSRAPGPAIAESVVVLTCNRAELWIAGEAAPESVLEQLAKLTGTTAQELLPHVYVYTGIAAARHAMRVAAGLDSLLVGEPQILGQLGRALSSAQKAGTAGPLLSRLFLAAVQAGKRARSETEISRHTVSISHAAAGIGLEAAGAAAAVRALVVGTGEAAELAARALLQRGVEHLVVTGRTAAHADALAERVGATVLPWTDLRAGIGAADLVVSATAAPEPVIDPGAIAPRAGRALALVDLAVPHDVDVAVGRIPGVTRFDLDDLRSVVDAGLARRTAAVPAVDAIIADEAERYRQWLEGRRVVPVITELRERIIGLVYAETRAALDRLGHDDAEVAADRLAPRIATKVLHDLVVRLKAHAAGDGAAAHVEAIRDLFALSRPREAREGT